MEREEVYVPKVGWMEKTEDLRRRQRANPKPWPERKIIRVEHTFVTKTRRHAMQRKVAGRYVWP